MESLARAVAMILAVVLGLGLVSSWFAFRPARRRWSAIVSRLVGAAAVLAGLWLLSAGISRGASILGVWVGVAGLGALIRSLRRPAES